MSKDKYPSIFLKLNGVYFPSNIFPTSKIWKLGNVTRIYPGYSRVIFSHVTRLDQSRGSENSRWIINVVSFLFDWLRRNSHYNLAYHARNCFSRNSKTLGFRFIILKTYETRKECLKVTGERSSLWRYIPLFSTCFEINSPFQITHSPAFKPFLKKDILFN